MVFDLSIKVTADHYEAYSSALGFVDHGVPVCMVTLIKGLESFLSIGDPVSKFKNDPEFQRIKESYGIRVINPFAIDQFDSKNAARVILFYVLKAHRSLRGHFHPWIQEAARYFWDRCILTVDVEDFDKLRAPLRAGFVEELDDISLVRSYTIVDNRTMRQPDAQSSGP